VSDITTALLNRLKAEQAEYALQSLKMPVKRDEFEYGYRAGIVGGLEKALDTLLALLKDERDGDKDL